jgi:murein DD-endopeptidase MepM/ murein hydrolase activator NlpD
LIAAAATAAPPADWRSRVAHWAEDVNLVPDLGQRIGSREWLRGLLTCAALCAAAIALGPRFEPLPGAVPPPLSSAHFDELRSQMVTPLALGADSGHHMGPTAAVVPLRETPERPRIDLAAAVGSGDSFAHLLRRSGVGEGDAAAVLDLVRGAVDPAAIRPGARVTMTLGRRPNRNVPRPLDALSVRARLDLSLVIARQGDRLAMTRVPIAVDATPLRLQGRVGDSLYRSARAAGADPRTIQSYLKVLATRLSVGGDIGADDRFDIIVAHRRAATGESETGRLLYAGLDRAGARPISMLRWTAGGREQWFEASGVGEKRSVLTRPVAGYQSSSYGMRLHPILGYTRMHAGIDFAAPYGAPIYAVTDGRVVYAGRHGGHGNYVRLDHGNGIGTGYAHMSRIVAEVGERVRRGQVIGYVGSTGLSTGPHLHYELYRNGVAINPSSVRFSATAQLAGAALQAFRTRLAELKRLPAVAR